MKGMQAYLTFNGNCREAMESYAKALGAELSVFTWGEAPQAPAEGKERVMHARLTGGSAVLMASDMPVGRTVKEGENFSLSVECESLEEEQRIFAALSEGGTVTMPLQDTFWASHFGMLTDKFGVRWMLDLPIPAK